MSTEEITFKNLSKVELSNLKDLYVESRLNKMNESDLRSFFKSSISDQVHGTVGNEEEKEAWKEMKDHFKDDFDLMVLRVMKSRSDDADTTSPEQKELERRIELLEKRKEETNSTLEDMW